MCYKTPAFSAAILFLLLSVAGFIQGQTPTPNQSPTPHGFKRWIDVETFTLSTRYRYIRANNGTTIADQEQWQTQLRPRLKFDAKAKYSIVAFIGTGNVFTGGWNNTGVGTGRFQSNLFVKQLYFDARPTKKIEVQFGGIDINRGEGTEITTLDNDGYLTGERVTVRAPKQAWFDEISATNAFLGDVNRPSIFGRLHRLNNSNYHQLLVRKQVTKYVGFSADYTFLAGTDLFHEAVRVKPHNSFFSTLLVEAYQRASTPDGFGFNVFAEHTFNKKLAANVGLARIDRRLTLNADRFPPGKRAYAGLLWKPNKEFTFNPVVIQGVGPLPSATTPRTRVDIILTWNVLETLRRHGVL